jgi:ribosome-associated protein
MLPNPDDEQEFDADDWKLLDCGDFVVHLMSSRAREFYDLEKLWFQAERTEVKAPDAPTAKA